MAVVLLGGVGLFSCNSQESKPEPNETQTEEKSDVQNADTLPTGEVKAAGDTAILDQTKKDETVINPVTNNNTPKQQDKLNPHCN